MTGWFVCILPIVTTLPSAPSSFAADEEGGEISRTPKDDFLNQLDDKIMRVNRRKWTRLKAWGEVLDAAGWCVSLPSVDGGGWLSPNARQDSRKEAIPPADRHAGGGVFIWANPLSGHQASDPLAALTVREREVFNWLRAGKSDAEISLILGCAVRTVEKHVANLYQKLGVKNRVAAIFNSNHPTS